MNHDDLPALLRRRARALEKEGRDPQYGACLMRAADELIVRRRAASGDENVAVECISDARRLRSVLADLFELIKIADIPVASREAALQKIRNAVLARRELGKGRKILAVEVYDHNTKAELTAKVLELLESMFPEATNGEATTGEEGDTEEAQPSGAGRDPHQPPPAQGAGE